MRQITFSEAEQIAQMWEQRATKLHAAYTAAKAADPGGPRAEKAFLLWFKLVGRVHKIRSRIIDERAKSASAKKYPQGGLPKRYIGEELSPQEVVINSKVFAWEKAAQTATFRVVELQSIYDVLSPYARPVGEVLVTPVRDEKLK